MESHPRWFGLIFLQSKQRMVFKIYLGQTLYNKGSTSIAIHLFLCFLPDIPMANPDEKVQAKNIAD